MLIILSVEVREVTVSFCFLSVFLKLILRQICGLSLLNACGALYR